jgi:hypothetical protein
MSTRPNVNFKTALDEAAAGDLDAWFRDEAVTDRDRVIARAIDGFLANPIDDRARLRQLTSHLRYARLLEDFAARMKNRAVKEKSQRALEEALRALVVHGFVTREAEMLLSDIFDVARLKLHIDSKQLLENVRPYAEGRALHLIESAARGPVWP